MWRSRLKLNKLTQYLLCFMTGSLGGWVYETVLELVVTGYWADRGVLHLPICPIYGFGALIILAALGKKRGLTQAFLYGVVLSTALELAASYLLEWRFHLQLWSYQQWPLNFQGRISLPSSLIFGIFSMIFFGLGYPRIEKLVSRLPVTAQILIDSMLLIAVIVDGAVSFL